MNQRTLALAASLLLFAIHPAQADDSTVVRTAVSEEGPDQELNINVFRNPSIGLEYRRGAVSVHGGLYPTIISKDAMGTYQTSWFLRAGLTHYFLPHAWYGQRPSELYVSASYLRGLDHEPANDHGNAALLDAGYRWMVWRGLNVRFGAAVMLERHHPVKVNPTPGLGWSASW